MDIEYIREFVVLAETRNFNETAERLFTTQGTISKHLKQMETELGTTLFTRTSRRVQLNSAGEIFLSYARKILELQYQYTTELENHLGSGETTLTIGSLPVMAQYGITDIIARFNQENRKIHLKVLEAEAAELIPLIREGRCELAFTREAPGSAEVDSEPDRAFVRIPYCTDRLAALVPAAHRLAGNTALALEALSQEPLLFLKEKTFLYEMCRTACEKAGFSPNVVFSSHRIENLADLVERGMGLALLMEQQFSGLDEEKFAVVPIEPEVTSQISLIYLKNRQLSFAAQHFLRYVIQ